MTTTLEAFSPAEFARAKRLLATQVASMMGRKLEEGDWSSVYCRAKGIPDGGWSNLHIDVSHLGLGVELKLLRVPQLNGRPLKSVCGTSLMHPAATRSIRIDDPSRAATAVKDDVLGQYAELIRQRTNLVRENSPTSSADMRTGWLIWEDSLTEFLYFEERMIEPDPGMYVAEWNTTPARGIRKASKSLWVYDAASKKKRYSVTTSAGVKIQPYFDVPLPTDPYLYYFRVQGEPAGESTTLMWIAASTAASLKRVLSSLDKDTISQAIERVLSLEVGVSGDAEPDDGMAVAVEVDSNTYNRLLDAWEAVSDEHRAQMLLKAVEGLSVN